LLTAEEACLSDHATTNIVSSAGAANSCVLTTLLDKPFIINWLEEMIEDQVAENK
jgi:hypothetical protein